MSQKEEKYTIEIAKSDKKASSTVNSFKVRKSGNSSIVTVPNVVKETLGVRDGEEIQYITVKDKDNESMIVMKKANKKEQENAIDEEVKELLNETLEKYDGIIRALAEL
ncbi:MAG TPA: hypothetical protein VK048_01770 [Atopostipes sp.]|nr:hypothetical protein [Atopostipes sp.]